MKFLQTSAGNIMQMRALNLINQVSVIPRIKPYLSGNLKMTTEVLASIFGRIQDEKVRIAAMNQTFSMETSSIQSSYAAILASIAAVAIANIGCILNVLVSKEDLLDATARTPIPIFFLGVSIAMFIVVFFGFQGRMNYLKIQYASSILEFIVNVQELI